MKLIIHTQVRENYGAHSWDGKGQCPQYWKAKGGDDYEIAALTHGAAEDLGLVHELVDRASTKVTRNDNYFREEVIGHSLLNDDEHTHSELNQLEYEGRIIYPRRKLSV